VDTTTEEDFGLSVARLLHTPLFSGLAAIGGVIFAAMLPDLFNPGLAGQPAVAAGARAEIWTMAVPSLMRSVREPHQASGTSASDP